MSYRVPSFSYPGGKARIRERLVKMMPSSGRRYVEPFVGRGNVFWLAAHMLSYREWWLNDPWTARWLEAVLHVDLRKMPKKLTPVLAGMYRSRALSDRASDDMAVVLEVQTMWAGGGTSINEHCKPSLEGFMRRILDARRILQGMGAKITDKEWDRYGLEKLGGEDFVYMDPPYLGGHPPSYYHDTVDHLSLVRYLVDAPHLWMISGNPTQTYKAYLGEPEASWQVKRSLFRKRHIMKTTSLATECVWTNYTIEDDGSVTRKIMKRRRIRKKKLGK